MNNRLQSQSHLMAPAHPLLDNQRSIFDILVRINYRDERPSTIQYASRGRGAYMLERYSRANFIRDNALHCWVEEIKVDPS